MDIKTNALASFARCSYDANILFWHLAVSTVRLIFSILLIRRPQGFYKQSLFKKHQLFIYVGTYVYYLNEYMKKIC